MSEDWKLRKIGLSHQGKQMTLASFYTPNIKWLPQESLENLTRVRPKIKLY